MIGNQGAQGATTAAADEADDARAIALALMSRALGHLDSDSNIPSFIGAQLQSAIDALWTSSSNGQSSNHLH